MHSGRFWANPNVGHKFVLHHTRNWILRWQLQTRRAQVEWLPLPCSILPIRESTASAAIWITDMMSVILCLQNEKQSLVGQTVNKNRSASEERRNQSDFGLAKWHWSCVGAFLYKMANLCFRLEIIKYNKMSAFLPHSLGKSLRMLASQLTNWKAEIVSDNQLKTLLPACKENVLWNR